MSELLVETVSARHEEAHLMLDKLDSYQKALYEEAAVLPPHYPQGVPLSEKVVPTCELPASERSSLVPGLVRRADVDASKLVALLDSMGDAAWDAEQHAMTNCPFDRPAHDKWGVGKIMLIHCDDFMQACYHFPWYTDAASSQWRDAVQPFFDILGVPAARVVRCLLAKLPSQVTIPVHHDTGLWVGRTHRCHAPIVTDPTGVVFRCGHTNGQSEDHMQRYRLDVGGVFELNNQAKHYVSNWGANPRVHLIFDYVDEAIPRPPLEMLHPGESLMQTRRSLDRQKHAGRRPVGPAFLILGAQKSGTTAVYEYLHQHPLTMRGCKRETHALDWKWDAKLDKASKTLQAASAVGRFYDVKTLQAHPSMLCGDSTPSYLLHGPTVVPRLLATMPWQPPLMVCLRDPVARAYSHYQMVVDPVGTPAQLAARGAANWRGWSFADLVNRELALVEESLHLTADSTQAEFEAKYLNNPAHCPMGHGGHSLVARGLYALQLEPWLQAFSLAGTSKLAGSSVWNHAALRGPKFRENVCPHLLAPQGKLLVVRMEDLTGAALGASGNAKGGQTPSSSSASDVAASEKTLATQRVMDLVSCHVGLPYEKLRDTSPQNARPYPPLQEHLRDDESPAGLDAAAARRLRSFYAPHNARLGQLLGDSAFADCWQPKPPPKAASESS